MHRFLLVFSILFFSTLVQANDAAERTIRAMMCASPKSFFGNKAELKKELNELLTAALRFEKVGSISELASKAQNQKIRYATRSLLSEAVFLAAVTENRAAFVDLAQFENNLCKSKKDSGHQGCEKLTSALSNHEAFHRIAQDQYEFIQEEKNQFSSGALIASNNISGSGRALGLMKWPESNDQKAPPSRQVLEDKAKLDDSLKELSNLFQDSLRPKKADRLDNCERKVVGALKDRFENYDGSKSVIVAPKDPTYQEPVR